MASGRSIGKAFEEQEGWALLFAKMRLVDWHLGFCTCGGGCEQEEALIQVLGGCGWGDGCCALAGSSPGGGPSPQP